MNSTRGIHVAVKNEILSFYIGLSLPKLGLLNFETEAKVLVRTRCYRIILVT